MGAEPWSCFVPYQADVASALEDAHAREFAAGRYRMLDPDDPPGSIEEACEQDPESGTASVLDMLGVADEPHGDVSDWLATGDGEPPALGMVAPLSRDQLLELYGTDRPSREQVLANQGFFDWLDRGLGIYIVVHDDRREAPTEIFFAGYSFD